jgi:glycosyltransferase involved in cell wall biosynthesis
VLRCVFAAANELIPLPSTLKKDTLIIFSPGFAANEADSTCIPALQQFALQLKDLRPDLDIRIFSLHYPFAEGSYIWNGILCHSFGGRNRRKPYSIYLRYKAKKYLRDVIGQNNVKAILSIWMWDSALIGQQLMNETGVSHFCWMHGQDARANNHLVKKIRPKPGQVIAISDILQEEFRKNHGITATHVVDNGITESLFPEFNYGEREFDVIGVGSLTAHKNYSAFVHTIAELKQKFPSIKSMIIGEGEQREKIQNLIHELDLQNNLVLKGAIPHSEALKYMSKSKLFLHTSTYEGSSGVIMEALYSGCYVVSTISVSLQPVKNVQLAEDPAGLSAKIATLLARKDLKHEKVIFNTMRYSTERIIQILNL